MVHGKKLHISLDTDTFEESLDFYRAFFGVEPSKRYPDYVKFELEQPGLNLTLNKREKAARGNLNHLGIEVSSQDEVLGIAKRLNTLGLKTDIETQVL